MAMRPLAVIVLFSLVAGCGGSTQRGEVEGVVTLNGVPLPEVQVMFTPDDTGTDGTARLIGYTDGTGKYRLLNDRGESGAPVGRYTVTVTDPRAFPKPGGSKGNKGGPPASRVAAKYGKIAESPLKAEIRPGPQPVNVELARSDGNERRR